MKLQTLLENQFALPLEADREILGLASDSRRVKPGDLFIALNGTQTAGSHYITESVARGAVAVLTELEGTETPSCTILTGDDGPLPIIAIPNLKQTIGQLAARYHGNPAHQLTIIGVTGTNGKTSCSHFIADVYMQLGVKAAIIGTLGSGVYGALTATGMTTPDALSLQATLAQFVSEGVQVVAMEVSSHSIDQARIAGIPFVAGIFTNLTQDHLDYHGTMAAYANVKRQFLASAETASAVINADDAYGASWVQAIARVKPTFTYTCNGKQRQQNQITATDIQQTSEYLRAEVITPWGEGTLILPLIGLFNLSNGLAVLTTLCAQGLPFEAVRQALAKVKPVPGRMQQIGGGGKPLVVVDYAHTPDALEKTLCALRAGLMGQLWCVFGCGGERDALKRPLMGAIAERYADHVIITNDNPRSEDPAAIAASILAGMHEPMRAAVVLDRSQAIKKSIQSAQPADAILIAGKGAERYQQIGATQYPFDDLLEAKQYTDRT